MTTHDRSRTQTPSGQLGNRRPEADLSLISQRTGCGHDCGINIKRRAHIMLLLRWYRVTGLVDVLLVLLWA
ncbi:MAG: hypothetical protein FWD74_11315 [Actinomycetia bacterium]|nr:hypothetical protein [Actinomycetes bacterium]